LIFSFVCTYISKIFSINSTGVREFDSRLSVYYPYEYVSCVIRLFVYGCRMQSYYARHAHYDISHHR
jgi:hypothetical protein